MKRPSREEVEREIAALDTTDGKALRTRWQELYRTDPPPKFRARLLRLGIAYRLQELAFGGLKPQTIRLLRKLAAELRAERVQKQQGEISPLKVLDRSPVARPLLAKGSQLMREWNGSTEIVDVVDEGFRWRGTHYRTLSAVAGAITGTKWSGPKFFGLVRHAPTGTTKTSGRRVATCANRAVATEGGSA